MKSNVTPLRIALPSKGRLQEKALLFFQEAGLPIVQPGGARHYRGVLQGFEESEVLFLSAAEIASALAVGTVHLGITGLDLIEETVPSPQDKLHQILPLGFGHADVVIAVPQAWIDVTSMADLADVAADFRLHHGRRLRVATKLIHLTQRFFAHHGIVEYRIVESIGATEGAPANGTAELIVDITSSGETLAANHLKLLRDGTLLKSQACLIASLKATWEMSHKNATDRLLDRIAARIAGTTWYEIKTILPSDQTALLSACEALGCRTPFGRPSEREAPLIIHCPSSQLWRCVDLLRTKGARLVRVLAPELIFLETNPLSEALQRALPCEEKSCATHRVSC